MERTRRELTETGKWLATLHHLGNLIPDYCKHLLEDYSDCWANFDGGIEQGGDTEIIPEIQHEIKKAIRKWIHYSDYNDIKKTIEKMNESAKKRLHDIMPIQYRGFFEYQGAQFPIELSNPVPFFPCQRNLGNIFLQKPISLERGQTTIIIRNVLCSPYDLKAWVALCQIRKRYVCHIEGSGKAIVIHTSYDEIAQELCLPNPMSPLVHENIRRRLERLRDMGLTYEYGKKFYDSSLVHLSTNLEEDSEFNIEVHLDKFWIEIMQTQFNGLNTKVLYRLRGRLPNLYIYLNRDMGFNKYGQFNSEKYRQHYWDVYQNASLRSPLSKKISIAEMKNDLSSLLEELINEAVISTYSFKNDYLIVK